jgi:hypothetical protein
MISLQHGVDEAEQRTTGNNLCVSGMDEVPAAAEGHLVQVAMETIGLRGFLQGEEEESGENWRACNLAEGIFHPSDWI